MFLLSVLSCSLFAENQPVLLFDESQQSKMWCFKEKQQTVEAELTFLYLTSTMSTPYSSELLLLNSAIFPLFTDVIDAKTASVDPEYNASFQSVLRYHIPSSNHLLVGSYRYIHNDASGQLKRDTISDDINGITQRNIQDDNGNQHAHVHTIDLMLQHYYRLSKTAVFYIASGMTVNDIHYFFSFHNNDQIFNSSGNVLTTQLDLSGDRKIRLWGIGPKLGVGFEYSFLPLDWHHDLNFNVGFEFSFQFAKKWGRGKFRGVGHQELTLTATETAFTRKWEDKPEFELLPNINLDIHLEYRYCSNKNLILSLTGGYRIITFWEIYDLNREVNFRMERVQPILAAQLREEDSVGFAGPYVSLGISY